MKIKGDIEYYPKDTKKYYLVLWGGDGNMGLDITGEYITQKKAKQAAEGFARAQEAAYPFDKT